MKEYDGESGRHLLNLTEQGGEDEKGALDCYYNRGSPAFCVYEYSATFIHFQSMHFRPTRIQKMPNYFTPTPFLILFWGRCWLG